MFILLMYRSFMMIKTELKSRLRVTGQDTKKRVACQRQKVVNQAEFFEK